MGADFGVRDSIEELLDLVGEAIEMGAPRIKLKCAKGWVRVTCRRNRVATRYGLPSFHEPEATHSDATEVVLKTVGG